MSDKHKILIKHNFDNDLKQEWKELEKNSNLTIFQTYYWQIYWNNYCKDDCKMTILLYYKNNKLISIFPLVVVRKYFLKIVNWSGFPFSDYNQPLIRKNHKLTFEDLNFIIQGLKKENEFDAIHLINNVNKEFLDNKKFKNNKIHKLIYNKDQSDDLIINKLKKKIKYDEKRLKEKFKFKLILNANEEEKLNIINFFITEKNNQFERTKAWNYLKIRKFKDYILNLDKENKYKVNFSCIKINEKIISSHIGYLHNNSFYYIFPVYDNNYKKYSHGNILLLNLIEHFKSNNYSNFDFTIGNENYKKKISNHVTELYDYIYCRSLLGFFYIIMVKLKLVIKKYFYEKN